MISAPSPNFDERPGGVAFLVLHYTGMRTAEAAIARLRDPAAKVSAHYVVDEDGTVYALVPEEKRAWHAGVSFWRGVSMLNDASIGIEIVNPGHEFGYRAFPERQMAAVTALCLEVLGRWPGITPRNVVGHSDIAPNRKQDPGELFGWPRLAAAGVGLWSDADAPPGELRADLAAIGYDTRLAARDVILAFQRHFMPAWLSGEADEPTRRRAAAVRALVDGQA